MERAVQRAGVYADSVDAPSPLDPSQTVKLGLRTDTFDQYRMRGLRTKVAQYYGLVQSEMMLSQHLFRGLKRPLMLNGNKNADRDVMVYTWRPEADCIWAGSRFNGYVQRITPPPGVVFAVVVREEPENDQGICGSIEQWVWVRQDPLIEHAPVDWRERYGKRVWSKNYEET
jgi:hypothetical protein